MAWSKDTWAGGPGRGWRNRPPHTQRRARLGTGAVRTHAGDRRKSRGEDRGTGCTGPSVLFPRAPPCREDRQDNTDVHHGYSHCPRPAPRRRTRPAAPGRVRAAGPGLPTCGSLRSRVALRGASRPQPQRADARLSLLRPQLTRRQLRSGLLAALSCQSPLILQPSSHSVCFPPRASCVLSLNLLP